MFSVRPSHVPALGTVHQVGYHEDMVTGRREHEEAALRAQQAGITVIMDPCMFAITRICADEQEPAASGAVSLIRIFTYHDTEWACAAALMIALYFEFLIWKAPRRVELRSLF